MHTLPRTPLIHPRPETAQGVCVNTFAYAQYWFSHGVPLAD